MILCGLEQNLKQKQRDLLRKHYWKAFIVCLILGLLTGGNGGKSTEVEQENPNKLPAQVEIQEAYEDMLPDGAIGDTIDDAVTAAGPRIFGISLIPTFVLGFTALAMVVGFLITILFTNVIEIGASKFFLDGFKGDVRIGNMFSIFSQRNYSNMVLTQLKRQVFTFLWTLLLIIPGIIKTFEYSMIPFILADEPDLTSSEVFERSKALTKGNKFSIFVLELSFLGWYILGTLAFMVGRLFVHPYRYATFAKLYERLKVEKGFAKPEVLNASEVL